jgi:hypothetical protein
MPRLFEAYVMVDWSAASKPTTGSDSIWIGVMRRNVRNQFAFEATNPATRHAAEQEIMALLKQFAARDHRVLLGFDFPLGFPRGSADALKLNGGDPPWLALWRLIQAEVKDKADNANNRFQVGARLNRRISGGPFPFWGAPAREEQAMLSVKRPRDHSEGDVPEFRHADVAAHGAGSVWKLYYQGSVGGQALTGMPVVARIKAALGERMRVFPFETGFGVMTAKGLEGVDVVASEIYPSLFKAKPGPTETKDLAQVRASAEHFCALDDAGKLGAVFDPKATKAEDVRSAAVAEEGWVLGA